MPNDKSIVEEKKKLKSVMENSSKGLHLHQEKFTYEGIMHH